MLEQQAAEKGIELTLASCPEGIAALGDGAKIDQVVLNLCSNALKFTPAGGRVEVVCESRGDQVAVLVSDTGEGISSDQIERIFEPFVHSAGTSPTHRKEPDWVSRSAATSRAGWEAT